MKTIQINDFIGKGEMPKQKKLIKELYNKFLKDDNSFHYLLEPQLIIRSSNEEIISKVEEYLKGKKYLYEIYNYPKKDKKRLYGEDNKVILNNLELFNNLFHSLSVLMLTLPEKEWKHVSERAAHLAINMRFKGFLFESQVYSSYAIQRAYLAGQYNPIK